jgi:hypothetical protein
LVPPPIHSLTSATTLGKLRLGSLKG